MVSSILFYSTLHIAVFCAFHLNLSPLLALFLISRNYIRINVATLGVCTFYSTLQMDGSNLVYNFISRFPQCSRNSNCGV